MFIKMNSIMKHILESGCVPLDKPLDSVLQSLAESSVVEMKGCFFLKSLIPKGFEIDRAINSYFDLTEIECSVNNIYIQGIFFSKAIKWTEFELLAQGYKYAMELAKQLEFKLATKGNFKIVLGFLRSEDGDKNLTDCSVRFYKVRKGEPWITKDLEDYKLEAILTIDIGSQNEEK